MTAAACDTMHQVRSVSNPKFAVWAAYPVRTSDSKDTIKYMIPVWFWFARPHWCMLRLSCGHANHHTGMFSFFAQLPETMT
ncbi:MAG: hypothetical protein BGN84_11280 [Afipia sp. 62-7]|nr:MAG: hypothetical protein BGN84_11280 [Afipia sp. 62-7]